MTLSTELRALAARATNPDPWVMGRATGALCLLIRNHADTIAAALEVAEKADAWWCSASVPPSLRAKVNDAALLAELTKALAAYRASLVTKGGGA